MTAPPGPGDGRVEPDMPAGEPGGAQNLGVRGAPIRIAGPQDAHGLSALLFRSPQPGRTLIAQHRPDPFARSLPYDDAVTFAVDATEGPEPATPQASGSGPPLAATVTVATRHALVAGVEVAAAYVFDLAVEPALRRGGHARRLLAEAEAWARERGTALMYANVLLRNRPSLRLFRSAGYRPAARLNALAYPIFRRGADPPDGSRPVEDWTAAAGLMREGFAGFDLARRLDGPRLHRLWSSLPGWRREDVFETDGAVLGLWDYSTVMRPIPIRLARDARLLAAASRAARAVRLPAPSPPQIGIPLAYGLVLGGAGDPSELRSLFPAVLERARRRGLDLVIVVHDRRARPGWARRALALSEPYWMLTRPLGPAGVPAGRRPVWVDPIDI